MASTAIGMLEICAGNERPRPDELRSLFTFDDLPAAVVAAVGAGAVRQLDLAAVRAGRGGRALQGVVGAPLVAAGFRMTSLRVRHGRAFQSLRSTKRGLNSTGSRRRAGPSTPRAPTTADPPSAPR